MVKKDYKKKFKELNLLQAEAAHQRSKYKNLNKSFAKKKTPKEETVVLDDTLDINSSSRSEADNSPSEDEKTLIAYDSESSDDDESSRSYIGSVGGKWINGCKYAFIIDKLKPNSK